LRVISNCDIFSAGEVITDRSIAIEGDRIVACAVEGDLPESDRVVDLKGLSVCKGLVDFKVMDHDGLSLRGTFARADFDSIVESHVRAGTVALFVATTASQPDSVPRLMECILAFRSYAGVIKGMNILNIPNDRNWIGAFLRVCQELAGFQPIVTNQHGSLDPGAIADLRDQGVEVFMTREDPEEVNRIDFLCEVLAARNVPASLAPVRRVCEAARGSAEAAPPTSSAALKYLVQKRGVTRLNAIRLMTEACAAAVDVRGYRGSIHVGEPAELLVLDNEMNIKNVIFTEDDVA
jgi:N-acetylglucosamine-6-phosphate deacetylase